MSFSRVFKCLNSHVIYCPWLGRKKGICAKSLADAKLCVARPTKQWFMRMFYIKCQSDTLYILLFNSRNHPPPSPSTTLPVRFLPSTIRCAAGRYMLFQYKGYVFYCILHWRYLNIREVQLSSKQKYLYSRGQTTMSPNSLVILVILAHAAGGVYQYNVVIQII